MLAFVAYVMRSYIQLGARHWLNVCLLGCLPACQSTTQYIAYYYIIFRTKCTMLCRSVRCCANTISTISFGFAIVKRDNANSAHSMSYGARANRNGFCPYVVKCTQLQNQSNTNIVHISLPFSNTHSNHRYGYFFSGSYSSYFLSIVYIWTLAFFVAPCICNKNV